MTDKINELKALIETLDADSPLRKQLQEALDAELNRKAKEAENANEPQAEQDSSAAEEEEKHKSTLDELKDLDAKLQGMLDELEKENPSSITGKLEKLMEDDEFITAAAGFVLGAAVTGISALAISTLKK